MDICRCCISCVDNKTTVLLRNFCTAHLKTGKSGILDQLPGEISFRTLKGTPGTWILQRLFCNTSGPKIAEDHQTKNALALVNKQAAIYVKDSEAETNLLDVALSTVKDEQKLKELSENIARLALPDSAKIIAQEVIKLAEKE